MFLRTLHGQQQGRICFNRYKTCPPASPRETCALQNFEGWKPNILERSELASLHPYLSSCTLITPRSHCCCCSVAKSCPALWTPWTAACQASLSFAISQSLLKLMSIESVMLSNHLILCCPLLLLPLIFQSIRVFSSESALCIRWPEYRSSASASASEVIGEIYLLGTHLSTRH